MQHAQRRAYKIAAVKMKLWLRREGMRCMFSTIYWSSRREFSLAQEQVLFREKFRSKPPLLHEWMRHFRSLQKQEALCSSWPSVSIDEVSIGYFSVSYTEKRVLWILYRVWNAALQIFSIKVTWYQTSRSIHIQHRCLSKRETKPRICSASTFTPCFVSPTRRFMTSVFRSFRGLLRDILLHFRHWTWPAWGRSFGREPFVIFRSKYTRNSEIFYTLALCPPATVAEENDGATR